MNRLGKMTLTALGASVLLFQWGCNAPAASKTTKGTLTGAAVGGVGAAVLGEDLGGIAAAGAAGAAVGAIIGGIQQSKENKRQDTLAQQRDFNQAMAMQKRAVAKDKEQLQEELNIAEGFRISNQELDELTSRAEEAEAQLKALQDKRNAALERKKTLDELEQREKDAIAEAARLAKELAELEGKAPPIN